MADVQNRTTPARSSRLPRPAPLYRALARAEVVTWTLLLLGMLGKYALGLGEWGVRIGGGVHGFVFLGYCLVTVLVAVDRRWRLRDLALGLGSAVLPFATVPFERYAERAGLLADDWRLPGTAPAGPAERVVRAALTRPVLAALVALVAVTLVFSGLLALGPPTEWFA